MEGDVDVIPNSGLLAQHEFVCISNEPQMMDPCQESFSKWRTDQMEPADEKKGNSASAPKEYVSIISF